MQWNTMETMENQDMFYIYLRQKNIKISPDVFVADKYLYVYGQKQVWNNMSKGLILSLIYRIYQNIYYLSRRTI